MFKVVFTKLVPLESACAGKAEQFYRCVDLTFAPFVGLSVSGNWGTTDAALSVRYDTRAEVFWCDTGVDESLLEENQARLDPSERVCLEKKIAWMEDLGWLRYTREQASPYWPSSKA
jgi:hypothetical protein